MIDLSSVLRTHGVSLKEVAEKTSLTEVQLAKLEQGNYKALRISTIESLCCAIGCKPGELFTEAPDIS